MIKIKFIPQRKIVQLLGAIFLLLASFACNPDEEEAPAPSDACVQSRDCGVGYECVFNPEQSRQVCKKVSCDDDSDCVGDEPRRCHPVFHRCVEASCETFFAPQCADDQVCLNEFDHSFCVAKAQLEPAAYCQISPVLLFAQAGLDIQLSGAIFAEDGRLLPFPDLHFVDPDIAGLDLDRSGHLQIEELTFSQAISLLAQGRDGVSCSVTLVPLVAPPVAWQQIALYDALSGDSVDDATVMMRLRNARGEVYSAQMHQSSPGQYRAAIPSASQLVDVNVFHQSYDYVSLVAPADPSIIVALSPARPQHLMAGRAIDLDTLSLHSEGDYVTGLSSASVLSLSDDFGLFSTLIGEIIPHDVHLEGVGEFEDLYLAANGYIKIGASPINDAPLVLAKPGPHLVASVATKSHFSEMSHYFSGELQRNYFHLLPSLSPGQLSDHTVSPIVDLSRQERPEDPENIFSMLPVLEQKPSVESSLSAKFSLAEIPLSVHQDQLGTGVLAWVGSQIPGIGLSVLGLGRAYDKNDTQAPVDGVIDPDMSNEFSLCSADPEHPLCPSRGELAMHFAPAHEGLQGYPLRSVLIAGDLDSPTPAPDSVESLIFIDGDPQRENFAAVDTRAFLPYSNALFRRQIRSLSLQAASGADFLRVRFYCQDRQWQLWVPAQDQLLDLPLPPEDFADCSERVMVESFALRPGNDFQSLARSGFLGSPSLDQTLSALSRQAVNVSP